LVSAGVVHLPKMGGLPEQVQPEGVPGSPGRTDRCRPDEDRRAAARGNRGLLLGEPRAAARFT
ncbi:MAG: hypothetical protein R6X22_11845, partial [Gemmatimonadota bacterium]